MSSFYLCAAQNNQTPRNNNQKQTNNKNFNNQTFEIEYWKLSFFDVCLLYLGYCKLRAVKI